MTPERQKAIRHAIDVMAKGLPWGGALRTFRRERNARAVMVSFDTNILVYATVAAPEAKTKRARDLIARGMRAGWSILLLQTLAEFSSVAIREAGIPVDEIERRSMPGERCCPCKQSRIAILRWRSMRSKCTDWGFGMRCCGLRRSVLACATCSPKTYRTDLCCRASDSSTPSSEQTIIGRRNSSATMRVGHYAAALPWWCA